MNDCAGSPEPSERVREWIERRARFGRLWVALMNSGDGCIMPRRETVDPRYLDEPLRSEVIAYLRATGEWADD